MQLSLPQTGQREGEREQRILLREREIKRERGREGEREGGER
jgi:hypothetical protein